MTWLVKGTTAFKREYKLMQKRAVNMQLLQDIVIKLANGDTLPEFFVSFRGKKNQNSFAGCFLAVYSNHMQHFQRSTMMFWAWSWR